MKTLLAIAAALLLVLAVAPSAWAHGHGRCGHRGRPHVDAPRDPGPDLDGNGRITNYERILYERRLRFERLHG